MSSTTSKTSRRARFARRAAIAAAGLGVIGATAIAATPNAFAASTPGPAGQLNGTVIVTSTLSIQPSSGSFTLTATPGQTTSTTPFTITVGSSDGGGYSLVEALTTPFGSLPDTEWATDTYAFDAGSNAYVTTPQTYDAAGDALTIFQTNALSGNTGNNTPGFAPAPYSSAGSDVFTTVLHLALPANQPGSSGSGIHGAFDYQVIGA